MELYVYQLINSDLLPKYEYKSYNLIESSEIFIKSLYQGHKSSHSDIHLEHIQFRQIIYGLASTKKNKLVKEFAARFHIFVFMPERSAIDLYNIRVNANDSVIKNYKQYFEAHNCSFNLDDNALHQIAQFAYDQGTGSHSLVQIIEKVFPIYAAVNNQLTEFN